MNDDMDFPRLTPSDDRLPSPEKLFRSPEDLTDNQLDLLAAAWVEDALPPDSLQEFEAVLASSPEKRVRAESFRKVRLNPMNERWEGKEMLIRKSPLSFASRRTVIISLAAAVILALIMLGPSIFEQKTTATFPQFPESTVMTEAIIPAASPVTVHPSENVAVTVRAPEKAAETIRGVPVVKESVISVQPEEIIEPVRVLPVETDYRYMVRALTALATMAELIPMEKAVIPVAESPENESNWIIRSISFLASAITKEEKNIDGYVIASACVKGINGLLGWDMELEQVKDETSEQAKVSFNSSLLSFSTPMNKNQP